MPVRRLARVRTGFASSLSDLAARFKELRLSKGLSSTALAKPKYSTSYVSQIERGQRKPSVDAARYFARRLGVSPEFC